MNDLTELRDLFADKPHPTADRLAPARTALLAEARTKRRPRARAAGLRRLMLAGALVAATTAGAIAVQTFNPAAPASAAEVLRLAAAATTASPWSDPRDDQYLHYEQTAETRSEKGVRNPGPRRITAEIWESVDDSRPSLIWHKPPKSHPQHREYKQLLTRCPSGPGSGRLTYADLRKWPTDQEQLRRKLAERGNKRVLYTDAVTQTWNGVVDVLGSPVPPQLQAAIFRVAATLPGIETEELTDATGKTGIAVTRVDNRGGGGAISRESLIFDKTSYVLVGGQDLVPGKGRELWSVTRPRITDALPAWSTSVKQRGCG
ncbi:CU044_5270 family protein [Planomonospora sp. ID67723]|uniref:CU044_5270 family protein n=1 Tax=Planomonospora sp. ID67723 TaxID=2738134 RepID=UPI0018C3BE6D|nr:CU044_5270 family protein [Planomonospora sp. ID67723]MBG0831469.1 CU044_5270 family protein [Planomonospora sp. ID67723]